MWFTAHILLGTKIEGTGGPQIYPKVILLQLLKRDSVIYRVERHLFSIITAATSFKKWWFASRNLVGRSRPKTRYLELIIAFTHLYTVHR